jgi:hypothetical protein
VNIVLNPAEARVLGSLVEKNITIPTAFTERADQCLQPEEQPRAGNGCAELLYLDYAAVGATGCEAKPK